MARTACASETVGAFACIIRMETRDRVIATNALSCSMPQISCTSNMGRGQHGQEYCVTHGLTPQSRMNVSRGSSGPHCAVSFDFALMTRTQMFLTTLLRTKSVNGHSRPLATINRRLQCPARKTIRRVTLPLAKAPMTR